ncbi:MAG: hypothetical protein CML13_06860 [Puniceicoccaceae bacterium]|nr:hypothetical protein [Puniceicoccaceae bacterium]|tara:strand:- start:3099 stop:3677 length:579 start_codon:yes stop_codon:yes gene_type:complete
MLAEINEAYILFIERAYKLHKSSFWEWLTSKRGASDMARIFAGDWLAHDGLSEEALDAFCCNLRLLIQDGDGFSLREIGEITESWPEKYSDYKQGIEGARNELQARLAEPSLTNFSEDGKTTNKELFDILFYGGLVHSNPNKREEFKRITEAGLFSFFVFQSFSGVLMDYRNCIERVAYNLVRFIEEEESGD